MTKKELIEAIVNVNDTHTPELLKTKTKDEQQTTNNKQQTTNNKQQTTNKKQQTTCIVTGKQIGRAHA